MQQNQVLNGPQKLIFHHDDRLPQTLMHVKKGKKGEVKGEYGRVVEEVEGNADYGVMVQPSQQHIASCMKGIELGLGARDLRIGIVLDRHPVEVTQDAGVVPR